MFTTINNSKYKQESLANAWQWHNQSMQKWNIHDTQQYVTNITSQNERRPVIKSSSIFRWAKIFDTLWRKLYCPRTQLNWHNTMLARLSITWPRLQLLGVCSVYVIYCFRCVYLLTSWDTGTEKPEPPVASLRAWTWALEHGAVVLRQSSATSAATYGTRNPIQWHLYRVPWHRYVRTAKVIYRRWTPTSIDYFSCTAHCGHFLCSNFKPPCFMPYMDSFVWRFHRCIRAYVSIYGFKTLIAGLHRLHLAETQA